MSYTCISVSLWILDRNPFVDNHFMIISNQCVPLPFMRNLRVGELL